MSSLGEAIGIAGSVPIAHGFGIYASYAHGFMDVDLKDVEVSPQFNENLFDFDADYNVAELGFSYTPNMAALLPHLPLSAATVMRDTAIKRLKQILLSPLETEKTSPKASPSASI